MAVPESSTESFVQTLNFVAIDIETTGLDYQTSEIIELAAIRFQNGEPAERFETLVKPRKGVPKFIEFLTHISPQELNNAPSVKEALKDLAAFIGNDVLVGHNVGFDLGFINHYSILSGRSPLSHKSWDTSELARIYLPFTTDHKLSTLVKHFELNLENAHRATNDATATGNLLIALSEHILKHYSLLTNARLLDLSKQAKLDDSLYNFLYKLVEYQRRHALLGRKPQPPDVAKDNVVDHQEVPYHRIDVVDTFSPTGLFSRKFGRFEFRSGQLEMARLVDTCFRDQKHLCVEAGTGVGKSFAYLVPAIAFSARTKTKVVVSTNTKNLQEQLFYKDLPQLKEIVPLPFKAALVKGRENYICERRWEEVMQEQTRGISPYDAHALLYLFIWKMLTKSGDVSENSSFDRSRFSIMWRKVCSDRFLCMGKKCPHATRCYVLSLRKHIETASIVVVNHSLLLADQRMDNTTLGEFEYLVVDEAHNLTTAAVKHLGFDLSYAEPLNFFNQLSPAHKQRSGFLQQLQNTLDKSVISEAGKDQVKNLCRNLGEQITALRKIALELFTEAGKKCTEADSYGKLRIKSPADFTALYTLLGALVTAWKEFQKELQALFNVVSTFNSKQMPTYDTYFDSLNAFVMRSAETETKLLTLENPDLDNNALWIENQAKSERNIPTSMLCYAPVDVSQQLFDLLYNVVPSIVFTSATLALRGSFKYFYGQSGLSLVAEDRISQAIVDSPFDFDTQSRLMIGSFLPEHKDRFFLNQALGCVEQIITTTNVGTMILFTSYKDLNSVYDHIGDTLYHSKRPFFAQGKAGSRSSILEEFKRYNNAVLLGTSSFWEGVDIQGESLSLLILFKLPFQVPSEPVVEALIDKLEREQKDSFMHFMLPNALLRLRQGFGRLIRSRSDRGVVLIMDSRVSKKKYGEYFKQVLPTKCLELRSELELLSEVSRFFTKI